MAQINFNDINLENGNKEFSSVGFFSLKNDGDEAIVRFMHDSTDSFDIVSKHSVSVGGKYRSVNCVRSSTEPIDNCPLCANNVKLDNRIYIHMIHYVKDENGNIVGVPKVWERSLNYAAQLKSFLDEYGPLSNCIFRIKRNGAARSMNTTYSIMFCNPNVYNDAQYPRNDSAFDGYTALGRAVMNKSKSEIVQYLNTGSFPETQKQNSQSNQTRAYDVPTDDVPFYMGNDHDNSPVNNSSPFEVSPSSQVQRPVRYY